MPSVFTLLYLVLFIFIPICNAWTSAHLRHRCACTAIYMAGGPSCWANEQGLELVQRFGSFVEDEPEKIYALEALLLSPSQDAILDAGLKDIANAASSTLGRCRWPVRLPSRRSTLGCYGRILAEMNSGRLMASQEEGSVNFDLADEEGSTKQQRRNLLLLLKQLSTYPKGVWSLEGEMIKNMAIDNFGSAYGELQQVSKR